MTGKERIRICEVFWIISGKVVSIIIDDEECLTSQEFEDLDPRACDLFHKIV